MPGLELWGVEMKRKRGWRGKEERWGGGKTKDRELQREEKRGRQRDKR